MIAKVLGVFVENNKSSLYQIQKRLLLITNVLDLYNIFLI